MTDAMPSGTPVFMTGDTRKAPREAEPRVGRTGRTEKMQTSPLEGHTWPPGIVNHPGHAFLGSPVTQRYKSDQVPPDSYLLPIRTVPHNLDKRQRRPRG